MFGYRRKEIVSSHWLHLHRLQRPRVSAALASGSSISARCRASQLPPFTPSARRLYPPWVGLPAGRSQEEADMTPRPHTPRAARRKRTAGPA